MSCSVSVIPRRFRNLTQKLPSKMEVVMCTVGLLGLSMQPRGKTLDLSEMSFDLLIVTTRLSPGTYLSAALG